MDEKEIAEIAAKAAAEVVKTMNKPLEVKILSSPEDKILADKKGGFKSFGHFLSDTLKSETEKTISPTLKAWEAVTKDTYMSEGDMSQGGYLVPEEFSANILQKSLETAIVRPRAIIQPMASNRIVIPADVDTNHQTNYFGGITIYRPGEGGSKTSTNPTYARIALTLHKVTGLCYVSDELLEDSVIAIEADITRKFSQAIAFVEDDDFLNGTGVNMPLGALNSGNPSLITAAAITGQGASTVVAENIRDMWARMYPAGQSRCVWLANNDVFPQLFGLSLAVGTGGVPIWLPAGGVSGAPYQSLMGRPLILTEKCQTLGTAGDIALVDFSQYIIGQKAGGGLQVATSIHVRFATDEQAFRFVMRYDGQPTWTTTLTGKYSSTTLSPFIVLNSSRAQ